MSYICQNIQITDIFHNPMFFSITGTIVSIISVTVVILNFKLKKVEMETDDKNKLATKEFVCKEINLVDERIQIVQLYVDKNKELNDQEHLDIKLLVKTEFGYIVETLRDIKGDLTILKKEKIS
jgi:predicted RND superfamily exporter protein